jgi:hypothetical protein
VQKGEAARKAEAVQTAAPAQDAADGVLRHRRRLP